MAMQVISILRLFFASALAVSHNWKDLTEFPPKNMLNRLMKKSLLDRRLSQELLRFVLPLQMQ